jgi:alpha-D-ribose 1-methylphosphonate 5-triphosphate synthase subunit PhnH
MSPPATIAPGLADPAHDSQLLFRAVLDAFAHPGRIVALPAAPEPAGALNAASTAFVLTLADRDTPLWLAPGLDSAELREFVRFHAGAPIVEDKGAAAFAVLTLPALDGFAVGSDPYPDRSATLVVQVAALRGGPALTLSGPGIDGQVTATIAGLPDGFAADWAANRALFPCGVDLVFTAGSELMALPRSIAVGA